MIRWYKYAFKVYSLFSLFCNRIVGTTFPNLPALPLEITDMIFDSFSHTEYILFLSSAVLFHLPRLSFSREKRLVGGLLTEFSDLKKDTIEHYLRKREIVKGIHLLMNAMLPDIVFNLDREELAAGIQKITGYFEDKLSQPHLKKVILTSFSSVASAYDFFDSDWRENHLDQILSALAFRGKTTFLEQKLAELNPQIFVDNVENLLEAAVCGHQYNTVVSIMSFAKSHLSGELKKKLLSSFISYMIRERNLREESEEWRHYFSEIFMETKSFWDAFRPPLQLACEFGDLSFLQLVLTPHPQNDNNWYLRDLRYKCKNPSDLLDTAAAAGNIEIVGFLLSLNSDRELFSFSAETIEKIISRERLDILKYLVTQKDSGNPYFQELGLPGHGLCFVSIVAEKSHLHILEYFYSMWKQAHPDFQNFFYPFDVCEGLIKASKNGNVAIASILADISNEIGFPMPQILFTEIARLGHLDILKLLLSKNILLQSEVDHRKTLETAIEFNQHHIAEFLLESHYVELID